MLNQHQTIKDNIIKYNQHRPLEAFLLPFIGDKKIVSILDIGSGAFSKIGCLLPRVSTVIRAADKQDFTEFYKKHKVIPLEPIEIQDMEKLTYIDNFFDIVHCSNALDHTENAAQAVREMIRVCKPGGYVYIKCWQNQKDTGYDHKWNVDGYGRVSNDEDFFDLPAFGFKITYIEKGGELRYNEIIAILHQEGGKNEKN